MSRTPIRRSKSADVDDDDPFTPISQMCRLRTPRTSRELISPLRTSSKSPEVENRKRGPETPLIRKCGPPLLKKSSMSVLADGFRTAACLNSEIEKDPDDLFGLTFRHDVPDVKNKENGGKMAEMDPTGCLPAKDMEMYKKIKKLDKFYDWQHECLSDRRLLDGDNCILSLPTGAGKTLIAEVLMLREAVVRKRNAILVLPYVAIVQEKISSLAPFEEAFGINIEEYASSKGRFPPIKRRNKVSVYVATIEKANMLVNSLITNGQLDRIGMVVVDELHMIGDGGRGAILEQLLAKFLYKGAGQIVGMSATLPNIDDLQCAMRAFVYSTDFRPVELTEFVKIGQTMHRVEKKSGELAPAGDLPVNKLKSTDPDGICQLLAKLVPSSSAVIFCPNKKNCENVAVLIAKSLPAPIRQLKRAETERFLASYLSDNDDERMDGVLKQCILSGVAYHHSGLTQDERKCVEAAFMEGLIYVVCATSTLAAGVNLPVRRVIIKCPMVGRERLGKAQYLQMAGRAGRAGFDTKGDCITIVKTGEEERWFRQMLQSEIPRCLSSLSESQAMASFVLDLVALKMAANLGEVLDGVRYSLLSAQKDGGKIKELVETALKVLEEQKFVQIENGTIVTTHLGNAVFNAGFGPDEAVKLHGDLQENLNQGVIFSSHFHLLFIITPYEQSCSVNWDLFLLQYNALPASERRLLSQCGLQEKTILEAILTRVDLSAGSPQMRLYIALMLQKIWRHEPMFGVAERFGVEKGWLQSTLQSAISQAAAIAKFSEKIETMWPLKRLLPELVQKLAEAAQPELVPLMAVEGVKKARAGVLFKAGYRTVGMIARANPQKLAAELGTIRLAQAKAIISSAKMVLRDQVDEKLEELDVWGADLADF